MAKVARSAHMRDELRGTNVAVASVRQSDLAQRCNRIIDVADGRLLAQR